MASTHEFPERKKQKKDLKKNARQTSTGGEAVSGAPEGGDRAESTADPLQSSQPSSQGRSFQGPSSQRSEAKKEWLAHAIEGEIIPRLLMAHRTASAEAHEDRGGAIAVLPDDVTELARIVLAHDEETALGYVEALIYRGIPLEILYLDLLAPVARQLGEGWNDDRLGFTEVTVGLTRLHRLIYELRSRLQFDDDVEPGKGTILVTPSPNEQHTLGLMMVADLFRNSGWSVVEEPNLSASVLKKLVASTHFDVVGLSISCERWLDELKQSIEMIRQASRNPSVRVLLGGAICAERPEIGGIVGADGAVSDGRKAVLEAEALIDGVERH